MKPHFHRPLVAVVAAGLTLSSFSFVAQAAPSQQPQVRDASATIALSARKRHHHYRHHYRHYGDRAALHAFGLIAGTIASIAAANAWRDRCGYYDCGYYGGYGYAYAPRYYYHRPYWHHHWNRGYSYHYNHWRPGLHVIP